jgi:hypothetical protein
MARICAECQRDIGPKEICWEGPDGEFVCFGCWRDTPAPALDLGDMPEEE